MGALGRATGAVGPQQGWPQPGVVLHGPGQASSRTLGLGAEVLPWVWAALFPHRHLLQGRAGTPGKPLCGGYWKKPGSGEASCPARTWGAGGSRCWAQRGCSSLPCCQQHLVWGGSNKVTISPCPAVHLVCWGSSGAPRGGRWLPSAHRGLAVLPATASHRVTQPPPAPRGQAGHRAHALGQRQDTSPSHGATLAPRGPEPSWWCRCTEPGRGSVWEREQGGPTPGRSSAPR